MALPQIQQPLFDYTLPVSGIDITYRPFLVGEEKILLVGKESDAKTQINAMKQILSNVIVTPEDINIDELTIGSSYFTNKKNISITAKLVVFDSLSPGITLNDKDFGKIAL